MVILVTISEIRSLAKAKAHLSELVARAGTEHERITVTVHGRPTAVPWPWTISKRWRRRLPCCPTLQRCVRSVRLTLSWLAERARIRRVSLRPCRLGEPLRERSAARVGHRSHRSPAAR